MAEANTGPAVAYGSDPHTAAFDAHIERLFGSAAKGLLTWGGTGANIVGLSTLVRPYQAIVCAESAHINVDECGGVERFTGSKLIDVPTIDGKLTPADVEAQLHVLGDVHHPQPGAISISQLTEYGTLYSVAEVQALSACAKAAGLRVHMDGARIANAAVALDVPVRAFTADAGVDVLSFGGTKNGLAYGEAVVFFDQSLVGEAEFNRKQAGQLPSKMRFLAAQFNALLDGDLWLRNGAQANRAAQRLVAGAEQIPGVVITQRPAANAVFARLPRPVVRKLQAWSYFYVWAPGQPDADGQIFDEVRWMPSFMTTDHDVDLFLAGVAEAMAAH
jgi:threonine aldolase